MEVVMNKTITIGKLKISNDLPFTLIAGPCVVESRDLVFKVAETVRRISDNLGIPYIFKASYKKANRTSISSFMGIGDDEALQALADVKKEFGLPVITDIHSAEEAAFAAEVADILQIPAFLCRQTELLLAAGKTGKVVNIKKGQFLSPYKISEAVEKVESTGNTNIMLTERGSTFGYSDLVVDMRGLVVMAKTGYPVVMDATHSVQAPGSGKVTGGNPEFIYPLAKAAAAVGISALFLEVHPDPKNALSDAASQLPLGNLEVLLRTVKSIDEIVKSGEEFLAETQRRGE